jgi:hypothetical protein
MGRAETVSHFVIFDCIGQLFSLLGRKAGMELNKPVGNLLDDLIHVLLFAPDHGVQFLTIQIRRPDKVRKRLVAGLAVCPRSDSLLLYLRDNGRQLSPLVVIQAETIGYEIYDCLHLAAPAEALVGLQSESRKTQNRNHADADNQGFLRYFHGTLLSTLGE